MPRTSRLCGPFAAYRGPCRRFIECEWLDNGKGRKTCWPENCAIVTRGFSIGDTNIGEEIVCDEEVLQPIENSSWPVRADEDVHLTRPRIVTIQLAGICHCVTRAPCLEEISCRSRNENRLAGARIGGASEHCTPMSAERGSVSITRHPARVRTRVRDPMAGYRRGFRLIDTSRVRPRVDLGAAIPRDLGMAAYRASLKKRSGSAL
jgi:hypothetical protein